MAERTLPHDLAAERAVLGSLLIQNSQYDKIASMLKAPMLYRDAHRRIYLAAVALFEAGKPLDLLSLRAELERRGELEEVGGEAYIASLVDGVPAAVNIRMYADIVREKAALCRLIKVGNTLTAKGYEATEPARDVIQSTEIALSEAATFAGIEAGAVSLADDAGALYREVERRVENRGKLIGFSSGAKNIDLLTHGLQRRKMIIIAGRTHMGKSVLAMQWALAIAKAGGRMIYYSLEMERQELQMRLLSSLTGIPLELINWGNLTPAQQTAIGQAWELLATLPIEINDRASMTAAEMRAECRQRKAEKGDFAGYVCDHVQLVKGAGENRTQELTLISRDLKILTGELDCVGLVVSQLNRGDKDYLREPQPSDLRESGALEQDCDCLAMIHAYDPRGAMAMPPPAVIPMKILFKKNRGGEMGVCCLELERECVRFVEAEPPTHAPKEQKAPRATKRTFTY